MHIDKLKIWSAQLQELLDNPRDSRDWKQAVTTAIQNLYDIRAGMITQPPSHTPESGLPQNRETS